MDKHFAKKILSSLFSAGTADMDWFELALQRFKVDPADLGNEVRETIQRMVGATAPALSMITDFNFLVELMFKEAVEVYRSIVLPQ